MNTLAVGDVVRVRAKAMAARRQACGWPLFTVAAPRMVIVGTIVRVSAVVVEISERDPYALVWTIDRADLLSVFVI